jgi:hypothetical protein
VTDSQSCYQSNDEIEAVVRGFESCTTTPSEFTHRAHLTVALSYLYLSHLTVSEATARMRESLFHFLDHHAVDRQKYNETITIFWIKLIRNFLEQTDTTRPLAIIANEMIESLSDPQLIHSYYSRERLSSNEARRRWIEPDVKPLEEQG